jgi:hypothetical protein
MFRKIAIVAPGCLMLLLLSTAADASRSCMTKREARRAFPSSHVYWYGSRHCWNVAPGRRHHARAHAHTYQRPPSPPPIPVLAAEPSAREADHDGDAAGRTGGSIPPTGTTTGKLQDRWPDVVTVPPPEPGVVEAAPPLMSARNVVMVIASMAMFAALIEVAFGGMIARRRT